MEPDFEQDMGALVQRCSELIAESQHLSTEHARVLTELEQLTRLVNEVLDGMHTVMH
jgi:hypothetical protein